MRSLEGHIYDRAYLQLESVELVEKWNHLVTRITQHKLYRQRDIVENHSHLCIKQ
jgi:hypothetical protein